MHLKKKGFLSHYLKRDLVVPFAEEEVVLDFSEKSLLESLGGIQESLTLMNMVEVYVLVFIVVLCCIGVSTRATRGKFAPFYRREQFRVDVTTSRTATIVNGVNIDEQEEMKKVLE